jgi:hypothetical protein
MIILTIGIIIFNKVEKVSWIQFKSDGSNLHENYLKIEKIIMKQLPFKQKTYHQKQYRPGEVGQAH